MDEYGEQYNRLFILGGKGCTEEDWKNAFTKYGSIEHVQMVSDRKSGESKGEKSVCQYHSENVNCYHLACPISKITHSQSQILCIDSVMKSHVTLYCRSNIKMP